MAKETRKSPRRKIDVRGFLYTVNGWPLCPCSLEDISQTGVRLRIDMADELPREMILCLLRNAHVRRHCEMIWRQADTAGFRFRPDANRAHTG